MDLRENKRYHLKAAVTFLWEGADGGQRRGEGHTRDISPHGVYVATLTRLPLGVPIQLEVNLPSFRETCSRLSLRTCGKVVRSEENGFAAAALMSFRIQFSRSLPLEHSPEAGTEGRIRHEAGREYSRIAKRTPVSRFTM